MLKAFAYLQGVTHFYNLGQYCILGSMKNHFLCTIYEMLQSTSVRFLNKNLCNFYHK